LEMVKGAQAESSKMRYIDTAKTEAAAAAAAAKRSDTDHALLE